MASPPSGGGGPTFTIVRSSHTCANDGVVEGAASLDGRAFSVQYHPEGRVRNGRVPVQIQLVELMAVGGPLSPVAGFAPRAIIGSADRHRPGVRSSTTRGPACRVRRGACRSAW